MARVEENVGGAGAEFRKVGGGGEFWYAGESELPVRGGGEVFRVGIDLDFEVEVEEDNVGGEHCVSKCDR